MGAGVSAAVLALAFDPNLLLPTALAVTALAAGALALHLIWSERTRHEQAKETLAVQASTLESLVESLRAITGGSLDEREILERARAEAEQLFAARATILRPGEKRAPYPVENDVRVPLRVHDDEIAALHLARKPQFSRDDVARATVLADFTARATEIARLVAEAKVREAERARLSDQVITAEQEERRRLAVFLHDTSVQSLSGIALMLDAASHAMGTDQLEQARTVLASSLERLRDAIRALRDLSFELEPVVLRDQGFPPAVRALVDQIALSWRIQTDVDVAAADALGEKAQVALYQIIREALHTAVRRGPPTRIAVRSEQEADGTIATVIADDAPGERRRAAFDAISERARVLNGRLDVDGSDGGGTTVKVRLPPYVAGG